MTDFLLSVLSVAIFTVGAAVWLVAMVRLAYSYALRDRPKR